MNREETVLDVIVNRRSIRKYDTNKDIPIEDLHDLIKAGVYAPSGSNYQTQRFLLINDRKEIERIFSIRNMKKLKFHTSAAIIIVFSDGTKVRADKPTEKYLWELLPLQDCAASMQNILLLAAAKGIGSCWVSLSDRMNNTRCLSNKTVRGMLSNYNIPKHYKSQGIVTLGYTNAMDENGYPKGYPMHGFINTKTARKPIENYMI
jgi:nitroreductase